VTEATTEQKRSAARWVRPVARIGFASKAAVYVTIGVLAMMLALGKGNATTDTRGAIHFLEQLPFGSPMLAFIALGMVGYALWRVLQGLLDLDDKGRDLKGRAVRFGFVCSGLVYASLALYTVRDLFGSASRGNTQKDASAQILSNPGGTWILGAIGVAVIGWGIWHFVKAFREKFLETTETERMSASEQRWMKRVAKLGLSARGVVAITLGLLALKAARERNPNEVEGVDGALRELASQPYGPLILALVAIGLAAYGVYWAFNVRYRRICAV
jgi:hypothetical protein